MEARCPRNAVHRNPFSGTPPFQGALPLETPLLSLKERSKEAEIAECQIRSHLTPRGTDVPKPPSRLNAECHRLADASAHRTNPFCQGRRAGRALNARRRGVKLLLFDSKTFSSKKKKKFSRAFFRSFFARAKKGQKRNLNHSLLKVTLKSEQF